MEIEERFIEFEKHYNLFDIKDENDFYIWDIIRYDLCTSLIWDYKNVALANANDQDRFYAVFIKLKNLIRYFLDTKSYDNFFYLCSRNKKHGKSFDQNAYSTMQNLQNNFLFETIFLGKNKPLISNFFYNTPQFLQRRFYNNNNKFDFSDIISKVKSEFGDCPFNQEELQKKVSDFFSDYYFFKRLFKAKKIKRVFVTQNGIQKGLFAAASHLNIPSYEFQHGIVVSNHPGYNYPRIVYKKSQLYLPDTIFTLSSFWFKDVFTPNVKIVALGNDVFSQTISPVDNSSNALTVISADIYGFALRDFLLSVIDNERLNSKKIYFKLHPNQFHEIDFYKSQFKSFNNVLVIANEYSMTDLLNKSDTVFTVQSTAVYEALQAGRKAILLKQANNNWYQSLLHNPNIYVTENAKEFLDASEKSIINYKDVYFAPYNVDVLKSSLV